MGKLALRTNGGTRLVPQQPVKVLELRREGEIGPGEVVYKVASDRPVDVKEDDLVQPGQTYGVVPDNTVGETNDCGSA